MHRRHCRKNREFIKAKFAEKGCRFTVPRRAIIDLLNSTKGHLSAEDVYHRLHPDYPGLGLTTVYRTLELLTEWEIVHKFDFGEGRARFELIDAQGKNHHHHLICTKCKRIIDYSDFIDEEIELIKKTEKALKKRHNFKVNKHIIEFHGICEKCREDE